MDVSREMRIGVTKSDSKPAKNSRRLAANFCYQGGTAAWVSQRTSEEKRLQFQV